MLLKTLLETPDGKVKLNPEKRFVVPVYLLTDDPNNLVSFGALLQSQSTPMTVSPEGPVLLRYFTASYTAACTVYLQRFTGAFSRNLMNRPVHIDLVAGNGQRPLILPTELFIPEEYALAVQFTDLSGAPNGAYFVGCGARFLVRRFPSRANLLKMIAAKRALSASIEPFWLIPETDITALGVGATANVILRVPDDAHFEAVKVLSTSTGPFTFRLKEDGTNYEIANGVVHSAAGSGNAQYPFIFPESYFLDRKTRLLLQITNLHGFANTIYFCLLGKRYMTAS
jgi:hypothetical protein